MKPRLPMKGAVAWMAENPVASNLLMAVLLIGGVIVGLQVKQEIFPEFEMDIVQIGVPYPGASPSEVEQGIVLAIEEEIRALDGVKRVTSSANENAAGVTVELELGTDPNKALQDVKSAVDRITSFPDEIERPVVSLLTNRRGVISLVIYGDQSEEVLRQLADRARDELLLDPSITYVELDGVRPREISVAVPQGNLRRYDVTLEQVAQAISRSARELPGGGVKTAGGEILVRTAERRDRGQEFEDIPVLTASDGSVVTVGDLGIVTDGFEDTDQSATFNGKPAVMINVYRSGDQTPIEVADAVFGYRARAEPLLPPGLAMDTLNDRSEMYRERMDLLLRNAQLGLVLVLIVLGLFLNLRLAFWVTMGIPISFLGSLILLPAMDVSINMISLFAFIITLGVVVDDAIVVGENIFEMREQGIARGKAAVIGAKQISVPVVFSVLTTIVAFTPLFMVPGVSGKFFRVIPSIVVCVLAISLVESLFILPAHLGHRGRLGKILRRFFIDPFLPAHKRSQDELWAERELTPEEEEAAKPGWVKFLERPQHKFSALLKRFIEHRYAPAARAAVEHRGLTIATAVGVLIITFGFLASGRLNFTFMPKVDSDVITAKAALPFGVNVEETEVVNRRLLDAARDIIERNGGDAIVRGVYAQVGSVLSGGGGPGPARGGGAGSHYANVQVFLVPSDQRDISAADFARLWRDDVSDLVGLDSLSFDYSTGPGAGASLEVELSHTQIEVLEDAAAQLAGYLGSYDGVRDIDDGFSAGKPQLDFKLTPEGESLGLTATEVGRQVRSAFFGAEALRQQRGRDEIRVMVRRPESERESEYDIENLMIRTPAGGEIPLYVAADVVRGSSYTTIKRADGRRVVTVSADTVRGVANADKILAALRSDVLPDLVASFPGLEYSFEGQRRRSDESLASLKSGFKLVLFVIFALLAIPFRSYIQPVVVMSAIPFGLVGAVAGHVIMGYDLSLISIMGLVAVSGIVVNDSLVLVHAANAFRDAGETPFEAILLAGQRRFRPILLTSLTTFFGLAPMIFEPSVQARFLIPMAISLGFGVLFATLVILLLVPSLYMVIEDLKGLVGGVEEGGRTTEPKPAPMQ